MREYNHESKHTEENNPIFDQITLSSKRGRIINFQETEETPSLENLKKVRSNFQE